jgi:uncharacterized lipoprotein YbaY
MFLTNPKLLSVVSILQTLFLFACSGFLRAQDRWSIDSRTRGTSQTGAGTSWQGSDWLGTANLSKKEWRIGVRGDNTETGILITEVAPNSAAARARIEPGDVIVAVEGFQVGLVSGRLYDLTEELNSRADVNGVVTLLVQDHTSGRLAALRIQLDGNQTQATLAGTLEYRERTPLPSDAIVTVQIENVTRPFYVVRNGRYSFRPTNGTSIPFEIAYDPSYIDAQDTYRVVAFVSSGQRTILDTPVPKEVLTKGRPNQVRLELASLSRAPAFNSTVVSNAGTAGTVKVGYPNYNYNNLDDRIAQMYQQYLGRQPTSLEFSALRQTPGIETRIETMPLELMAAQEYFDLVGNNNTAWLRKVFQVIVKRQPTDDELIKWMKYYENLRFSRTEVLRELNKQVSR